MILPAKQAVMVAIQQASGFCLLNCSPTSFLTARAARLKWARSNSGNQVAGSPCSHTVTNLQQMNSDYL